MVLPLLWHLWSVLSHGIRGSEIVFYVVYNVTMSTMFKCHMYCAHRRTRVGKSSTGLEAEGLLGWEGHKIKL